MHVKGLFTPEGVFTVYQFKSFKGFKNIIVLLVIKFAGIDFYYHF